MGRVAVVLLCLLTPGRLAWVPAPPEPHRHELPMPEIPAAPNTPVNLPVLLQRGFKRAPLPEEVRNFKGGKSSIPAWSAFFLDAAVAEAHRAGLSELDLAIDLAGICDRETCGNNVIGDGGHGHGPMQIDDRFHDEWLKANQNGLTPRTNIRKGAQVYVDCLVEIRRINANKGLGLNEVEIRQAALCAYNAGLSAVRGQIVDKRRRTADAVTTGRRGGPGDYGSNTWSRREKYRQAVEEVERAA